MFEAEARGKTSAGGEDVLTSRVIGLLRILEPRCRVAVLNLLLGSSAAGNDGEITFWPTFGATEPDVVVQLEDVTLVIEAKDVAGHLTSEQLMREWRDVPAESKTPVVVVALTADPSEPEVVLESRDEIESDEGQPNAIRWVRWQSLARVYEQLQIDPDVSDVSRRLIGELLRFMEMRGVRGFTGLDMEEINLFRETWSLAPDIFTKLRSAAEEVGSLTDGTLRPIANSTGFDRNGKSTAYDSTGQWRPTFLEFWFEHEQWPTVRRWADKWRQVHLFIRHDLLEGQAICAVGWQLGEQHASPLVAKQAAQLAAQTESQGLLLGATDYFHRRWVSGWEPKAYPGEEFDPELLKTGDRYAWRLELLELIPWEEFMGEAGVRKAAEILERAVGAAAAAHLDPDALAVIAPSETGV
jgi:hypothetical protein